VQPCTIKKFFHSLLEPEQLWWLYRGKIKLRRFCLRTIFLSGPKKIVLKIKTLLRQVSVRNFQIWSQVFVNVSTSVLADTVTVKELWKIPKAQKLLIKICHCKGGKSWSLNCSDIWHLWRRPTCINEGREFRATFKQARIR